MGGGSPAPPPPAPTPPDYGPYFQNLQGGQATIRQDISGLGNTFTDEAREIQRDVETGFDNQTDRFDDIDTSLTGLDTSMTGGFSDVRDDISGLGTTIDTRLTQTDQNIGQGFTDLGNQVNTGFTGLGSQVDTRFGEVATGMNTGFDTVNTNLGTGFTNLGNTINANDAMILAGQETGFGALGSNLSEVEANLTNLLNTFSTDSATRQQQIQDLLTTYGGNQDAYFQALSQGQSEQQALMGSLQTGLDDFRNTYDRDTTLANQQRGRISDAVQTGQSNIRQDIASQAQTQANLLGNVGRSVEDVGRGVADVQAGQQRDFANIAKQITTGFDDGTAQMADNKQDFQQRLDTVRQVLSDQSMNIDAGLRQTYSTLVSSFDDQGSLIQNSVTQNGDRVSRAIDQNGNLLIAAFDTTGNRIDQQALNINQLMYSMEQFGYQPGSNQAMAGMTGGTQPAAVYSGLASPFAQTR